VRRADKNHWGAVVLIVLGGFIAIAVLAGLADSFNPSDSVSAALFYGGILAVSVAVFLGVRRVTSTRRWWLVSLLCSPVLAVLGFIVFVNLAVRLGPVSASEVAGINYYPPPTSRQEMNFESDWQYAASWAAGSRQPGSSFLLQDKTVWIYIENKAGTRLVEDKFELHCCHPVATAYWPRAEYVEITLSEEGLERYTGGSPVEDPYSVALAKSGPRGILKLTYEYDAKAKRFRRTGIKVMNPGAIRPNS
jgi:hypothetical protein